jgi:S-(hydroxymethyl)glutathione dehydrogenase/alcohol dehydrogenase
MANGTLVAVPGVTEPDEALTKSLLTLSDVMGTGHHAALAAHVGPGRSVVVVGDGAVGLCGVLAAKRLGAERIIAMSRHEDRAAIAREFGATDFLTDVAAVKDVVKRGVDYSFECVGHVRLIRAAIDMLDWGGTCVMLGVPEASAEAAFNVASMYLDKGVLGCRYGSSQPQRDVRRYVDLYRQGRLKLDELVSRTYPLADFTKAVHDLESGDLTARGVLTVAG